MADKYDKVINKIHRFNDFLDDITIMTKEELDNVTEVGLEKFELNVEKYIHSFILDIKNEYDDLENSKYKKILNETVKKVIVFIKGWIFKYPNKKIRLTNVPSELERYMKKSFEDSIWKLLNTDGVGGPEEETDNTDGDGTESDFGDNDFGDNDFGGDFGDEGGFGGDEFGTDETTDNEVDVEEF